MIQGILTFIMGILDGLAKNSQIVYTHLMERILPSQEIGVGQVVDFDGKQLIATKEYRTGKAFKESGLNYFMTTDKGIMGFKQQDQS